MNEPKSLEEGWRDVSLALTSEELDKAVRALLLVGLEEARGAAGHFAAIQLDYCLCKSCDMRRQIEALGK